MPRPQNTGGLFWLLNPCNLETYSKPTVTSYLSEGDRVSLALPVYVVGLRQVQALEVQPELADVVVAGFDPVGAAPTAPVAPGVSDVPEAEVEGGWLVYGY